MDLSILLVEYEEDHWKQLGRGYVKNVPISLLFLGINGIPTGASAENFRIGDSLACAMLCLMPSFHWMKGVNAIRMKMEKKKKTTTKNQKPKWCL